MTPASASSPVVGAHFIPSLGCVVAVGQRQVRHGHHVQTLTMYRPNPHLYEIVRGVYIGHPSAILAHQLKQELPL